MNGLTLLARGADPHARLYGPGEMADRLKPGGGDTLASRVRATGAPVSDDDPRVVFGAYVCARGIDSACTAAK